MRTIARSLECFFLVATVSRASWLMKGKPSEVLVTNVTPLEGTAVEQQLYGDLRIHNQNEFDLFVTGIDLTFNLNGITAGPWIGQYNHHGPTTQRYL